MTLNNRSMWVAAALAGAIMAILSSVPVINFLNCLLCAWLWLGGMFAVWYYRREVPGIVTTGQGAMIGAVAGLVGAIIATVIGAIIGTAGLAASLASQAQSLGDAGDMVAGMLAGGLGIIFQLFFNLVFYILFGALGGLIATSLFGKEAGAPPQQGL